MTTILYLDDDEEDIFLFDKAINDINITLDVWYASCNDDFYNILMERTPDLIFLDIKLGDCSGIDCLKRLREANKWKHIPIVMYTMCFHKKKIKECFELRANYYLKKAGPFQQIVDNLKKILTTDWEVAKSRNEESFVLN